LRTFLHGGTDLTGGVMQRLDFWETDAELAQAIQMANSLSTVELRMPRNPQQCALTGNLASPDCAPIQPDAPAVFNVVASICTMSQLIQAAVDAVGSSHALFPNLMLAIRNQHLRLVIESIAPDGWGFLVVDMTSIALDKAQQRPADVRAAALAQDDHRALQKLIDEFSSDQVKNYFHGHSPRRIEAYLAEYRVDGESVPALDKIETLPPWKWTFNSVRHYLVYALRFHRR